MEALAAAADLVDVRRTRYALSLVIPALNEERHLVRCLESVKAQLQAAHAHIIEAIVVDNQSIDGTVAVAQAAGAQVVSVPPNSAARARNAGAERARGDVLAFVDADCELSPDWLVHCARHLDDPQVVAVGAAMRPPTADASWVEQCWYQIAHAGAPRAPSDVRWLPSFNLIVRRSAWEQIGGFDERLATCEDADLGYRLAEIGRLVFEPTATVAHHGESQTLAQLYRREAWRSQGNLQLALSRLGDLRNWASVLVPAASVGGLAAAAVCAVAAIVYNRTFAWGVGLGLVLFAAPFVAVAMRLARRSSYRIVPRAMIVLATYLAARTAGLFFAASRVPRTSQPA